VSERERPHVLRVIDEAYLEYRRRLRVDVLPSVLATVSVGVERARSGIANLELAAFPLLATSAAFGLLLIVIADARSRSTASSSQVLFWFGLGVLFVPIVVRLASAAPKRVERLSLVLLLGFTLYLTKVMHDPFGFTFADELAHAPNANAILSTHQLFHANSVLPVTPYYPGLESITAALASMAGISSFGAGLIVIGAARVVMMLGLFLLFERLSGSARVAGLAAAIYTANANFVFFSAQFSYESLALPLLVMVIFCVIEARDARSGTAWSTAALLGTAAIVVTHHMTSYALIGALGALCIATAAVRRTGFSATPWRFALFAVAASLAWLTFVASATLGYLTPVLTNAFVSTIRTVSHESAPRTLFAPSQGAQPAPLLERGTAIASILIMAAIFPFGLRALWRRHRTEPLALVFALAGAAFFGTVVLRLVPDAWETANRSSEFLFLGLSFVLALAGLDRWRPTAVPWLGACLTAVSLSVVFAGGLISGWEPDLRLSQPYRIEAAGHVIGPEGRQLARWFDTRLGPGQRIAASDGDGRSLATYAAAYAVSGVYPDIVDILKTTSLPAWQVSLLNDNRLRYVAVDRRLRSFDTLGGYFFAVDTGSPRSDELLPLGVVRKFEGAGADRIYDSGDIVVFDLGANR
jgi:4-amino-4-deoxy-L-arabinose transferase-like glycosyltransferase